jgi:uncharacterized membrane protein YeaQ/YmgE (transglycosylase-associated protein family)
VNKLFIYGGITIGGVIGAYVPVLLFNSDSFGFVSIVCGTIGSFIGLWVGYKLLQNIGE